MTKLILKFALTRAPSDRAKLQAYLNKHMMAVCLATPEEIEFLKANGFTI